MNNNIINKMDNNFVDNYDDLLKYKNNIDNILHKMDFKGFDTYNEFCIFVRETAKNKIKNEKIKYLDSETTFFSEVINQTLRNKIKENKGYDKKIFTYFGDYEILDILKENR